MNECRDKEAVSKYPCKRACKTCGTKTEYRDQCESDKRSRYHFCDTGKHGKSRKSHSLNCKSYCIYKYERNIESCVVQQELVSLSYNLCLIRRHKHIYKVIAAEKQNSKNGYSIYGAEQRSGYKSLFDTVKFTCTNILAAVCSHCGT